MAHDDRLEAFLQRLLTESDDPLADLAASEYADSVECRELLESLMSTESELQSAGRFAREALEDSKMGTASDAELVAEVLGQAMGRAAPKPSGASWGRIVGGLVAAAAAILLFVWLRDPGPGGNGPLGGPDAWTLLEPVGDGASFERFAWEGPGLEGGWCELRIFGPESGDAPLKVVQDLETLFWVPDTTESDAWPDTIRWRLTIFDEGAQLVEELSAEASR